MDINQKLTEELAVKRWQIDAAVKLIDEGNTIPFISRYRKEVTGSLNDEQLRKLYERLVYLRNLEEKKEQVISSIEEQGKLTEELKQQILAAETQVTVEDLYRPYRPKRRTRATIAKEKGLEPLAAYIMLQNAKEPLAILLTLIPAGLISLLIYIAVVSPSRLEFVAIITSSTSPCRRSISSFNLISPGPIPSIGDIAP